jgi:hypothetical protein
MSIASYLNFILAIIFFKFLLNNIYYYKKTIYHSALAFLFFWNPRISSYFSSGKHLVITPAAIVLPPSLRANLNPKKLLFLHWQFKTF